MTTTTVAPVEIAHLRATLLKACRILSAEEVMEGPTGHISVRAPGIDRLLIKPVMIGFEEITEDEFILMEFSGAKIEGGGKVGMVPNEYHIHTEIYKARPEIASVVHTHPPYCVALSACGQTPKAYNFESAAFAEGVPLFDETTDAITTPELGQAVVRTMGQGLSCVLKNHGVAVAGSSIEDTCLRNVRLEKAAWMHILANSAGSPTPLRRGGEGARNAGMAAARAQPTWDYYVRRAERILSGRR